MLGGLLLVHQPFEFIPLWITKNSYKASIATDQPARQSKFLSK